MAKRTATLAHIMYKRRDVKWLMIRPMSVLNQGSKLWKRNLPITSQNMKHCRENNRVKFIIGINIDITEQNLALQVLKENEEKFHAIFDLSPQPIAVTELKTGKLVDLNKKLCELSKSHYS